MKFIGLWLWMLCVLTGCKDDPLVYLAGDTKDITVYNLTTEKEEMLIRGSELFLSKKDETKAVVYQVIDEKKVKYEVEVDAVVDTLDEVVTNQEITVTLNHNLRSDRDEDISDTYVKKGETLSIVSCNMERDFNEDGSVDGYMVEKDGNTYYLDLFYTKEESFDKYQIKHSYLFDESYWYGQGYSKRTYLDEITYLDVDRTEFENNPFKKDAKAVHVGLKVAIDEKDYLISLCNESKIDTLVIELKTDSGDIMFQSDTAKEVYNETFGLLTKEEFKQLMDDYRAHGIYLIGRVVTFKDAKYANTFKENAILNSDGSLLIHNGEPWPSPYSRDVWRYTLGFCKEAVELGMNEIQFDYCRFPDGLYDDTYDYKNSYGESKVQAITHFLYYAREELRKVEGYLSVDVFGWNMISDDDQDIGQFIPALSNVVDAISPMPYPDHFGGGAFGMSQPWQYPRQLMYEFAKKSQQVINQVPSPAIYRTWIQGYPCLEWVCSGTSSNPYRWYGPEEMKEQINGIKDAGEQGYIVWSGEGGQDMFDYRKPGFIE